MRFNNKITLALIASLVMVPLSFAQESAGDENVEEVVVTGTRITNPNIVSTSQVQVVTAEDIDNRGAVRIEDVLNDLPQLSPGQIGQTANGANGTATANLRNLGCSRTLVLLNGKRMAPGTSSGGVCADISQVPALLIKRVEVLTGGATSVYGSDAISGVVNFILDDEFQGFKASATNSFYHHENDNSKLRALHDTYNYQKAPSSVTEGDSLKLSLAFGGSIDDGNGHITGYIEHINSQPILQGAYDGGSCALSGGDTKCGGSSTIPAGRLYDFGYKKKGFTPIDDSVSDFGFDYKTVGDEFADRAGTLYNYNPTNHYQRPQDKVNAGFFAKYSLTDKAELYSSMRFMQNESIGQIAYSGTFGDLRALPCYNANLSAQQHEAICGNWTGMGGAHAPDFATGAAALAYINGLNSQVAAESIIDYMAPVRSLKRNVEGGPRKYSRKYSNMTYSLGLRGDINDDWRYDISYQTSEVDYVEEIQNDLSITKLLRATNVISVAGVPTCVSVLDGSDPNCIPYNLFSGGLPGDGGIQAIWDANPEIQTYMAIPNFILGDSSETIIQAYVEGETGVSIPGAPAPVSAVFGYESRELESDYRPDASAQAADRTGAGGPSVALAGGYDVKEYFLELGVPVTDNFNLEIGARFADYSTDNDTDAFKLGGYWQINDQVSVRGTFQTATRHGGISELYRGQGSSLTDLDPDPCGTDPETGLGPTYTAQECARTGLAAVDYGSDLKSPADQYNILTGGNPNLVPEESESVTLGVVWTPASVPGLSVTLDYFDIEITDGIGTIPASTSLIQCLETGNPTFCGLIERDPIAGTLWVSPGQIITTNTNVSESGLTGYDITFTYPLETPIGVLDLKGISTITDSDTFIAIPGAEELQCAGYYGKSCGKNPTPEFAGNYSASLTRGDFDYVLGLRFLGETEDLNTVDIDIEDKTYLDFTVNYQFSDSLRFSVGASNILDEDPVYTSAAGTAPGNGNTFPGYFDALGTYIFINATFEM